MPILFILVHDIPHYLVKDVLSFVVVLCLITSRQLLHWDSLEQDHQLELFSMREEVNRNNLD